MNLKVKSISDKQPPSGSLANPLHIDKNDLKQPMNFRQGMKFGVSIVIGVVSLDIVSNAMVPGLLNWCVSSLVSGAIAWAAILVGNRLHIDREYPEHRINRRQSVLYAASCVTLLGLYGLLTGAMARGLFVSWIIGFAIIFNTISIGLIGNRLFTRLK